jgi:nucleoside-diphosphate-sugar epimerase
MAEPGLILVTGAGGGVGGVGGKVVALLRQRGRAVRAMAHHDAGFRINRSRGQSFSAPRTYRT